MMALLAKYDLKTKQLDAVNAFVNCPLDEVIYIRIPPYYAFIGTHRNCRRTGGSLKMRTYLSVDRTAATSVEIMTFRERRPPHPRENAASTSEPM